MLNQEMVENPMLEKVPTEELSDSKIVSILQREGLVLARRTIAKYREELTLPTSNQRRVMD